MPTVMTPTKPSEIETETASRMRAVIGRLSRRLRLTHADRNLSPSHHDVLGIVVKRGPLGLSEVATIEGLNPTMLSRIAARLEDAGLIVRTQDPDDGRSAYLEPTAAGRKLHKQIQTERTDALLLGFHHLSSDEQKKLSAALPALETLADALKRQPQ